MAQRRDNLLIKLRTLVKHAHKIQAAIAMSQRAKVASQRAKDPEKKKDLGQAHKVYQRYIDTNKNRCPITSSATSLFASGSINFNLWAQLKIT